MLSIGLRKYKIQFTGIRSFSNNSNMKANDALNKSTSSSLSSETDYAHLEPEEAKR